MDLIYSATVITGDLDRLLAAEIRDLRPTAMITSAGTWEPAPAAAAPRPGTYATPVAFRLADTPARRLRVAMTLAAIVRKAAWVRSVSVTSGHITVTVTAEALAALAVRITEAGAACARSTALAGTTAPAPSAPDLGRATDWPQAWRLLSASVSARLAEVAGARASASATDIRGPGQPAAASGSGPVAAAIAFAGSWAITYALARMPPDAPVRPDQHAAAAHHLGNPAYAVRYAHAHAASSLRQAADLGLSMSDAAEFRARLLAHPAEQWLLDELSWLPERVAGAARRRRPDVLTRYLERLAGAYFDCQEACPAMGPGPGAGGPETAARLWLAAATKTALRAGLDLLGVDAPDRL